MGVALLFLLGNAQQSMHPTRGSRAQKSIIQIKEVCKIRARVTQSVRWLLMKYWLYRWFMSFAHRHGWHKMDEFHPDGDTLLWCQWCGLRVVTKRRLTPRAVDGGQAGENNGQVDLPTATNAQQSVQRIGLWRWLSVMIGAIANR